PVMSGDGTPTNAEVAACRDSLETNVAEQDEERRRMLRLHAEGMDPEDISSYLEDKCQDRQPPAPWMIEDCIRSACQRVEKKFGTGGKNLDEQPRGERPGRGRHRGGVAERTPARQTPPGRGLSLQAFPPITPPGPPAAAAAPL